MRRLRIRDDARSGRKSFYNGQEAIGLVKSSWRDIVSRDPVLAISMKDSEFLVGILQNTCKCIHPRMEFEGKAL